MVYTPTHAPWVNLPSTSTPIMAENLDHIEEGIVEAHSLAAIAQATAESAAGGGDSSFILGLALDGTTDDGPAIQSALEDVEDGKRGAHLTIHGNAGKVCYINSTITVSASKTIIDCDVPLLFGPLARVRPWGTIDEQPADFNLKPALTADAAAGATVLHLDSVPAGWAAGDYIGLRGNRDSNGTPLSNQIFHSYLSAVNTGLKTITLVTPLDVAYKAVNTTTWTNKESQVTKVTQSGLTGTPDSGDVTINVGSTAIFEVGDMVQIIDETHTLDDGGAVQDGNFAHKEQALIVEILSGTSMKISHPLYHSYDLAKDARVQKLNAVSDVQLNNWSITFAATPSTTEHCIEVRYAYNTHLNGLNIVGTGDDGASWSGHAVRFTDSLYCSVGHGTISNPSDVTAGRGYGISFYGATLCWADNMAITGCRHSLLWFNGAAGCEGRDILSSDARISDYDWHGAACGGNRTKGCTAVGGTRTTGDSDGRTAWKWGNPSHRPGDSGNVATDCLVLNYAGTAIQGIPSSGEDLWQGVVRGAITGIKLTPLPIDDDQLLVGFIIRDSEFYDVTTPFDIDGGTNGIVRDLVIDNTRWHRSGNFAMNDAPGVRFTNNQVIDPTGTGYIMSFDNCDDALVKGNDFSGADRGLEFISCARFRSVRNDMHDLAGSTVVFRDGGGNTGFLWRDNDYIGYTPTRSNAGTASAGTIELTRATGGGGGGGTYPPAGGVPYSDLDSALQGLVGGAYVFPSGGIPKADLVSGVQTSLGKADTAYQLPVGGIPNSDLATPGTGGTGGGYVSNEPANHGYDDWNFPTDAISVAAGQAATAGRLELMRIYTKSTGTRTKVAISVGTAGSGMTAAYLGVFDTATGNQLAVSADISSSLTSTGVKSVTMVGSWASTAGDDIYVGLLCVGGTPASLQRATPSAPVSNAGLNSTIGYRFGSGPTGLTAMPGSIVTTSMASSGNTFWCAVS